MKFGQSIEHKMRNKLYRKCGGETIPEFVFIVCRFENYQNIFKLSCRPLAFTSYNVFLKKKRYGTSLPASFYA